MANQIEFDSSKFEQNPEYVCWIDIMGTKNTMSESFHKAANFILKFHCIVLRATKDKNNVRIYPLMDGVFVTSPDFDIIRSIIDSIFSSVTDLFLTENQSAHQFIVKGAISYGNIAHGDKINADVCKELADSGNAYRNSLMCGMPMIQAFNDEHKAPPFGVYIHDSARNVSILSGRYYDWYHGKSKAALKKLRDGIKQYFQWCERLHQYLCMDLQKIALYKHLVDEYFNDRTGTYKTKKKNESRQHNT